MGSCALCNFLATVCWLSSPIIHLVPGSCGFGFFSRTFATKVSPAGTTGPGPGCPRDIVSCGSLDVYLQWVVPRYFLLLPWCNTREALHWYRTAGTACVPRWYYVGTTGTVLVLHKYYASATLALDSHRNSTALVLRRYCTGAVLDAAMALSWHKFARRAVRLQSKYSANAVHQRTLCQRYYDAKLRPNPKPRLPISVRNIGRPQTSTSRRSPIDLQYDTMGLIPGAARVMMSAAFWPSSRDGDRNAQWMRAEVITSLVARADEEPSAELAKMAT